MDLQVLTQLLRDYFEPLGLESHLFKASWYNEQVADMFKLQVDGDPVCAVVLSLPSFFEKTFIPFVKNELPDDVRDPIDSCIAYNVHNLKNNPNFAELNMSFLFDYEVLPNRRPKVLVQTAAHVAGAAFYYQQFHITNSTKSNPDETENTDLPYNKNRKLYGVSIHPLYGGWFAIRCVIIFHDIIDANLKYNPPFDCVSTRDLRIKLLTLFNDRWKDWSYRDIIPVSDNYSDLQKQYFAAMPKHRMSVLEAILKL